MREVSRRCRIGGVKLLALVLLFGCAGCLAPSRLPADQAFALSASALAGSDRYSFAGEMTKITSGETKVRKRTYNGEVSGHRVTALSWTGPALDADSKAENGAGHPLALTELAPVQTAALAYEPAADDGVVSIKLALRPKAARERAAALLRADMKRTQLDEALRTLQASTVCVWTADRRSWFPTELREETEFRYRVGGRQLTERRVAVTHFRRKPDSAIIDREEGR